MICCACDRPADWSVLYVHAGISCNQNFCSKHSKVLWKEMRPLSNPDISIWQQERLFDIPTHYRLAA